MACHIQVRDLALSYHWKSFYRPIFLNLEFCIEQGSFVTILGGNGSGKSSLLKLILGLVRPDRGEILLNGKAVRSDYPEGVRTNQIAYLSQQIEEYFFADTVREELAYSLKKVSHEENMQYLHALDMHHLLDRSTESLSGGERQGVALAYFMGSDAPLLMLDEPSSYMDSGRTDLLRDYLQQSHGAGKTILHVTQYDSEISWGSHVLDLKSDHPEVLAL